MKNKDRGVILMERRFLKPVPEILANVRRDLGLSMVALYTFIFFEKRLYAESGLQIFFILAQLWGWYLWVKVGGEGYLATPPVVIVFLTFCTDQVPAMIDLSPRAHERHASAANNSDNSFVLVGHGMPRSNW